MLLYKLGHIVRDTFPCLWNLWSSINSFLFGLRYGKKTLVSSVLFPRYVWQVVHNGKTEELSIQCLQESNCVMATKFFQRQPMAAYQFFRPHDFDKSTLDKLIKDKSFLAYVVTTGEGLVVGYVFLRSFFWGKCYRGYITDVDWRRLGINKKMNLFVTDVAEALGLRTFGSISPDNTASLLSAQAVNDVKIIKKMNNGDYLVEYKKRRA